MKTTHSISLTFFSNFLSFDSRMVIFFVFCISSTKQYLVWHLFIIQKLALRVALQNYYSAILDRYLCRVMMKRSILQLTTIFLAQL